MIHAAPESIWIFFFSTSVMCYITTVLPHRMYSIFATSYKIMGTVMLHAFLGSTFKTSLEWAHFIVLACMLWYRQVSNQLIQVVYIYTGEGWQKGKPIKPIQI